MDSPLLYGLNVSLIQMKYLAIVLLPLLIIGCGYNKPLQKKTAKVKETPNHIDSIDSIDKGTSQSGCSFKAITALTPCDKAKATLKNKTP